MKYNKKAISISEQVEKLKGRGLLFRDESYAELTLSRISYYRLRAYTYPFQDNKDSNHPFIKEVDFETIIELYKFDHKLRVLVFDAIEKIEIALRTQIIYKYSMQHGSHWQMDKHLYKPPFTNKRGDTIDLFEEQMKTLKTEIKRSNETFIKHYKEKYNEPKMPPSWMSLEVASMGALSKIYKSLITSPIKTSIAREFGLPNSYYLENWMLSFSHIRNICAHHSRLWNRRLTANLKLPNKPKYSFYNKSELSQLNPSKVFSTLMAMNYILKVIEPDCVFNKQLIELMKVCPLNQQKAMGFTKDWEKHPFWN